MTSQSCSVVLFGVLLAAAGHGQTLLGQSQTIGEPLPFLSCTGAVYAADRLWTTASDQLYGFEQTADGWTCTDRVPLGRGVGSLGVRFDGQRLWFADGDRRLFTILPGANEALATNITLRDGTRSYAVAPVGSPASAKVLELHGDEVRGFAADGSDLGTLVQLARPADATWWYCAVGLSASGDLLVGSYYPDSKVYRYGPDGTARPGDGWPRTSHAAQLLDVDGEPWCVDQSGSAFPLSTERPTVRLAAPGTMYASGLTRTPDGAYWLATSQGLLNFDRRGRATGRRLGGLSTPRVLSIARDGTIVAAVEEGQRFVRLALDDAPDTAFPANANEPWRTGAGWSARSRALAWDNGTFLALDEVDGRLWRFDPWHTAWGEKPWLAVSEPGLYAQPRALAVGDVYTWLVADGKLWRARYDALDRPQEITAPGWIDGAGVVAAAASGDDLLVVAWTDHVSAWHCAPDGTLTAAWTRAGFARIVGLALHGSQPVISDAGAGQVLIGDQPYPVAEPGVVAVHRHSLVVYSGERHALVRWAVP